MAYREALAAKRADFDAEDNKKKAERLSTIASVSDEKGEKPMIGNVIDSKEGSSYALLSEEKKNATKTRRSEGDGNAYDEEELIQRPSAGAIAYKIFKRLFSSPIIISCILGFSLNLIVGHNNFPAFVLELMETLALTYSGAALFALGLSIKAKAKAGQAVLITSLCGTKVILLPLVMAVVTHICTQNQTSTEFAFLYGMLPTAPTVYIFAVNYELKETLISSSCLICLIASLPMILVAGVAIQIRGESSEERSNRIGIVVATWIASLSIAGSIVILVLAFFARAKRQIRGCWRVFAIMCTVICLFGGSKLACIKVHNDLNSSEAVTMSVFQDFFNTLSRSYGVVLAFTLCSRLQENPMLTLKVEKWGHITAWTFSACLNMVHGLVPSLQPRHVHIDPSAVGFQKSVLACGTKSSLPNKIVELFVQFAMMVASLVAIMRFQTHIKKQCRDKEGGNKYNTTLMMKGPTDSSGQYRRLANPVEEKVLKVEIMSVDNSSDLKNTKSGEDFETLSLPQEVGSVNSEQNMGHATEEEALEGIAEDDKAGQQDDKMMLQMDEACRDSTRYTLIVLYNSAGLILAVLQTIAKIFNMDQSARGFTQVVFILDVTFHLSGGVFLAAVFVTHRDIKWGLDRQYEYWIEIFPCIERFRAWAMGDFYLPDDLDVSNADYYRKPSAQTFAAITSITPRFELHGRKKSKSTTGTPRRTYLEAKGESVLRHRSLPQTIRPNIRRNGQAYRQRRNSSSNGPSVGTNSGPRSYGQGSLLVRDPIGSKAGSLF
eukprot:CAMPEP_0114487000 /NCGR_PEP_ID=MMETSP0109-20121206/524_1 /TAXON_ID=29199 /ORGANISM="Chlorarachnion reptans, Strain CCCM449" /LENGTH=774 /DNA_ID=CAMNT_0001663219 /DNA_START=630 /DNA_END=2954 /DNA_ORIENTATION=+